VAEAAESRPLARCSFAQCAWGAVVTRERRKTGAHDGNPNDSSEKKQRSWKHSSLRIEDILVLSE
jgi:hypothetical protein